MDGLNFAYGGEDDDKIYGTVADDRIVGDTEYRNPLVATERESDFIGGDDYL